MTQLDRRDEFLIAMYGQLMNDINRHITVVWQSVATLVAAVAVFSFVKDNILSMDYAVSIVILICVWLMWHVYDAGYWYNRNLVIISNIERQFLCSSDLKDIHYYFGAHRKNNKLISHLEFQKWLAIGVALVFLLLHFNSILLPILKVNKEPTIVNLFPWFVVIFGCVSWYVVAKNNREKYREFMANSPGRIVDITGITYGIGHGQDAGV